MRNPWTMCVLIAAGAMALAVIGCGQDTTSPQCNPACSSGQTCVQNASTGKTSCQTAGTTSCSSDSQCLNGQKCQSGACVAVPAACTMDSQCLNGQKCQGGVCASSSGCTSDSQCSTGQKCQSGACVSAPAACTLDSQCLNGQKCQGGTCVTATSSGTYSCSEVLNCMQPCSDNACAQVCFDKGTASAQQQYDAVMSCADAHNCQDTSCINTNCQTQIDACTGGSNPTGTKTCADLITCMGDCADSTCEQSCYTTASASAQQAYSAVSSCFQQNNCQDAACLQSKCATQLSACLNGTSTTGPTTCAEVNSCISNCNDDATCAQNCLSSATSKAQQDFQALKTCVQGHSCGGTTSCWKQYCSSEAAACGVSL